MKRFLLILVLSIVWSLLPNIILAENVHVPNTNSVSLLALDTISVGVPKTVEQTHTKELTTSLEEAKTLKKATLPNMVKAWWYNWKTDRKKLANEVWIQNYVGTMRQNSLIKNFLLSKVQIQERGKNFKTPDIRTTQKNIKAFDTLPIHKTVKFRGYLWEVDREKIANEVGIKNYIGSKKQNLLIKKYLRKKVSLKVHTKS